MSIHINVVNQKMHITSHLDDIVAGSQNFVKFKFNLSEDWDGLVVFAQFRQGDKSYNQFLNEENIVCLPPEIKAGTCTLMLYGTYDTTIGTTNYLTLKINENNFVSDANSTDISESLYDQLVTMINAISSVNGQGIVDLMNKTKSLEAQLAYKASNLDLVNEISRAKAKEESNANAILLKADQSQVDELALKVTELANNAVVSDLINKAVESEMAEYLANGQLANMAISAGSVTRDKMAPAVSASLENADKAMQPSVYDKQNRRVDVYDFALGQVNDVKQMITDAYQLTDTAVYDSLKGALQGALTLSRSYTDARLVDYKAFTIKIVDELPTTGAAQTFYLLPKESGTGYDKYWYITDDNGVQTWDVFGGSSTVIVESLPEEGEADVDYILSTPAGCLYYKFIEGEWKVVAGSIAHVAATLPPVDEANELTDYYVVDAANGSYIHYRFINGAFRVIGRDSYTKTETDAKVAEVRENQEATNQNVESNTTNIMSMNNALTKLQQDFNNLDVEGYTYYATYGTTAMISGEVKDNVYTLFQCKDGVEEVVSQFVIAGGGGGSDTPTTNLVVERVTASPVIATPTDKIELQFSYSSTDSDGEEIDGTYTWKLGTSIIGTGTCIQGVNTFDATDFVSIGTQKLTLTVVDDGGSAVVKTWTVQIVDVRLESAFSDKITYAANKTVNFTYTPYGAVAKTVHFILDGVELDPVVTTASGTLQSYTLPAQAHGAHLLECYITATVNSMDIETAHIFKDIIWYDEESTVPVIGCVYRYDHYGKVAARQYDSTNIVYYVFDPATGSPTVSHTADGAAVSTQTLTGSANIWTYKTDDIGDHTLVISCKGTSVTIVMDIKELGVDIAPVTANLAFDFNPVGLSNSSDSRLWVDENTGVAMSVSNNFDWINGGYQLDADGNQYFCVKAGTEAYIDYKLFGQDASVAGAAFRAIFKVTNVRDVDATFLSCVAGETPVGLRMDAHAAYLMTSGTGANPLYMPYSENDIIEFDYSVNPIDTENTEATALIMSYEDGTGYRPLLYDASHRLYQYSADAVPITIGSPDCDVHIYRMKAYTSVLSDDDILSNYIADARDSETMLKRYDESQIYNENNALTPEFVAKACPDLKIIKIDAPYFTQDKKEMVKHTTVQCIHTNGDAALDNWTARNCYHSGQGTTSNEYGYAGRNLNIYMCFDGNYTNKNCTYDAAYITELTMGDGTKYSDGTGKVTLTRTSVPNALFNIKVNIASSENANNALLAQRYHRYLPYTPVSAKRDPNAKTTMEFVNCVVFVRENDSDLSTHREFQDTEWHFYALGNIGDSKDTDQTRTNDPDDHNEFVVEIADNTLPNSTFPTGIYDEDGVMVYPIDDSQWGAIDGYVAVEDDSYLIKDNLPVFYELIDGNYILTGDTVVDKTKTYYMANYQSEAYKTLHIDVYRHDPATGKTSQVSGWGMTYEFRYSHPDITDEEEESNIRIFNEMYKWMITSSDEAFVSELGNWFIEDAALYMYLFTERYTMLDNRAKNTFWHWGKVYITEAEATAMGATKAAWFTIDNEKAAINNGYRFDFWDYDNDTSLGINNSGEMTQPYGREDIDYRTDGDPNSGYVFNAAESTFFRRIRKLMYPQLQTMYLSRESAGCWSANGLINEFDNWQNQFCAALWKLDTERKYYRTYYGGTKRFLETMMNGRKRYHRRQWERDQEAYMGTKYVGATVKADQIMFRCNTPMDAVVAPNYDLQIIPYTDMYLSVLYGNSAAPMQIRAKAGQQYTIANPLGNTMDDTAILIYCASRIQALNDLSGCYIHDNDFSKASKLQQLIIGNSTEGYTNTFMTELNIGNNALLKELNVRNCPNLVGSVNLTNCGNLETFYAEGTAITGVTFAPNGKIVTAYLPDTINTLSMKNLNYLTDLQVSYDNLESLTEENSIVDERTIVIDAVDTLQTLRLTGIDWTLDGTTLLNQILAMNSTVLSGKVYIAGSIRNQELKNYSRAWPDLEVTYNTNNVVTQYLVTYVNDDDQNTVLYEAYVDRGAIPPDPYAEGWIPKPEKPMDAQHTYEFGTTSNGEYVAGSGWSWNYEDAGNVIVAPVTIIAQYTASVRTYRVRWFKTLGATPLVTLNDVAYGSDVAYTGDTPTREDEEAHLKFNVFAGWNKSTGFITEDTDVYAVWESATIPETGKEPKDMSPGEIFAVTKSGRTKDYFTLKDYVDITLGQDFDFTNVESEVLAENLHCDGSTAIDKNISLFGENDRSFTMAIDYQFSHTELNNTLVSCFEEDGSEGFRLRYNAAPNIQWGDASQSCGSGTQRDIIVLRHRKGENKLYVYAPTTQVKAMTSVMPAFGMSVDRYELKRSRNTTTDQIITFGAIRFKADGGHDDYGRGHIHWCKIWYEDLGDTNARKLANWSHETIRMEYYGSGVYRLNDGSSSRTNASFICNHLLAGRGQCMFESLNTNDRWGTSDMRTFLNTRFLQSFPTVWQSMIKEAKIGATAGNTSLEVVQSGDRIYLPALSELTTTYASQYPDEGNFIAWYTTNSSRLKFMGHCIPDDAEVYTASSDPSANITSNLKAGDIWVHTGNANTGHVYVTQQYLDEYNITPTYTASAGGGWIAVVNWWLRSPFTGNAADFWFGTPGGTFYHGYQSKTAMGVCPCFSI